MRAGGLIELVVVWALPNAYERGISYDDVRSRARKAHRIVAILCTANTVLLLLFFIVRAISQAVAP